MKKLLRLKQIIGDKDNHPLIPISRSEIWRKVKNGNFPKPIKLSAKVTVWRSEDIQNYINQHKESK